MKSSLRSRPPAICHLPPSRLLAGGRGPGAGGRLLQNQHQVDHQTYQRSHHRSIDADELEVAAEEELEAAACFLGVPALDRRRDEAGDFLSRLLDSLSYNRDDASVDALS